MRKPNFNDEFKRDAAARRRSAVTDAWKRRHLDFELAIPSIQWAWRSA